jgi:hypothetical protein
MGFQSLHSKSCEKHVACYLVDLLAIFSFQQNKIIICEIVPFSSVLQMFLECVNQEITAMLKFQEQVQSYFFLKKWKMLLSCASNNMFSGFQ